MSKPKGRRRPLQSEITSLLHTTELGEVDPSTTAEGHPPDVDGTEATSQVSEIAPALEPMAEVSENPAVTTAEEPAEDAAANEPTEETAPAGESELPPFESAAFSSEAESDFDGPSNVIAIDSAESDDMEVFLSGLIESLLFTSQKPLDLKEIARSAGIDRPRARELLERLAQHYSARGINIDEVAGGYVLRSSPRYAPQVQKFLALRPVRLSRAQLETLAIVAYRQPVTKPEVDDIRGVDSGQVIKGLLERSLLKIVGKKDEPGRPSLYGTTNDFLELLNLRSLGELPTLREYTELSDESRRKFAEETGEEAPAELPAEDAAAVPVAADDTSSPVEANDAEAPPEDNSSSISEESPEVLATPEPLGGGEAADDAPLQPSAARDEDESTSEDDEDDDDESDDDESDDDESDDDESDDDDDDDDESDDDESDDDDDDDDESDDDDDDDDDESEDKEDE